MPAGKLVHVVLDNYEPSAVLDLQCLSAENDTEQRQQWPVCRFGGPHELSAEGPRTGRDDPLPHDGLLDSLYPGPPRPPGRDRGRSTIMLSWVGSRCWTRMRAMPLPAGRPSISLLHASRPPAEAPIPTTAKSSAPWGGPRAVSARRCDPDRAALVCGERACGTCTAFKALVFSAASVDPMVAVDRSYHDFPRAGRCRLVNSV